MKSGKSLFFKILLHVFLPLLVGFFIYIFYRPNVWITRFLNWKFNEQLKAESYSIITRWIIYSGPDFCWAYSFTSAIFILNHLYIRMSQRFMFAFVLVILMVSEIIQLFLKPYFTFSMSDLITVIAGCIFSIMSIKNL
jgi:hypothetical protein